MRKKQKTYINIEIDKLINSIENSVTGEVFDTEVIQLKKNDGKQIKKADWLFNWQEQLSLVNREVYKLVVKGNTMIIQGLVSLEDKSDHIFMHLIESAKFNRAKGKMYFGVPGNLVAFACKLSFDKGYGGFVSFYSKTKLKQHYQETLGAEILYGDNMVIATTAAKNLIDKYLTE